MNSLGPVSSLITGGDGSALMNIIIFLGAITVIVIGSLYIQKYPNDDHKVAIGLIATGSILLVLQIGFTIYKYTR